MSHDPISIIIPVYNEQENIRGVLDAIQREVKDPYRVLLIFDFDEDTTIAPAQSAAEDFQIDLRLIRNRYGKGAANAIRTGLEVADTEFMVVTMADGSDPP
ncbi:MAG: glycosyltransferase, partial [Proteobacteria bacterium]|nr:glycosyltransferase [Pseudomonadota bacterium]